MTGGLFIDWEKDSYFYSSDCFQYVVYFSGIDYGVFYLISLGLDP